MAVAGIAQLVEQGFCKPQVGSSSLSASTIHNEKCPRCGFELPEGRFCPICRVKMKDAHVVELVDTQVLGTCALQRGGSTPSMGTITQKDTGWPKKITNQSRPTKSAAHHSKVCWDG